MQSREVFKYEYRTKRKLKMRNFEAEKISNKNFFLKFFALNLRKIEGVA